MGLTVAFLAYMEAENIRRSFPSVKDVVAEIREEIEYMVIDSAEPLDDTASVCRKYGIRYINQEEPYYGGAIRTAFRYASMDKLLILDADGSPNPKHIPEIYRAFSSGADLVIASRYIEGGLNADTKSSNAMSQICNGLYRLALGVKVRDCSTSYRMYHTSDVKKLILHSKNFDIMEEILMKLKLSKGEEFVVKEIPARSVERGFGTSKRSLLRFIYTFAHTLIRMVILRILASKGYEPAKHERQSLNLTKTLMCVAFFAAVFMALAIIWMTGKYIINLL